ncbi:unnamed protein product, partial [Linum tenue]
MASRFSGGNWVAIPLIRAPPNASRSSPLRLKSSQIFFKTLKWFWLLGMILRWERAKSPHSV